MNVLRVFTSKVFRLFNNSSKFRAALYLEQPVKNKMLANEAVESFGNRHQKALELVEFLKNEIANIEEVLHQRFVNEQMIALKAENERLKQELKEWQSKVVVLEIQQGIKQVPVPTAISGVLPTNEHKEIANLSVVKEPSPSTLDESAEKVKDKPVKKVKKETATRKSEKAPAKAASQDDPKDIHVGRLDLRIGRIIAVEKHPDADSLYVEKIDLGEQQPRTVVSGLVKFVPIEEMQNRLVMVLCNLKPVKMRGVLSEAMVMCASTPSKVEILNPPPDAVPGDRVVCEDFLCEPDALLNPKKKIFELVAPDLKTDGDCVATYKLSPLKVATKGVVKAATLSGVPIK